MMHTSLFSKKPEQKNDSSTVVIGMQSRLVKIKDHITLLKAFAKLIKEGDKKITLKIAGDGDQKTELLKESAALQLTDRVEFTGMLAENELIDLMRSLDIYVHASMGETMSTAIMQAMASGKPIVASDVPGIKNMISNNETGLLVPVKDSSALTGAMQQLISNNELALRLGANAYRYAQDNFSDLTMFNRYKQIFNY